ncbi:MAG: SDR family oxidoreductase [Candidatus Rokubacteria bacterium]|nr:SDR family oxidoreductase [Candidatus Rokubacteria bacterium]
MRVLVTGHNGYIGSVLVPLLQQAGHDAVGLDSRLFAACTFGAGGREIPSLTIDLRDVQARHLAGFDAIAHLAGLSNDPLGDLSPDVTYEINHRASVRLARLAKRVGVRRFVHSSSCSIYGAAGDDVLTEEASFNPVTPYGISKVRVEEDVSRLADRHFSPTFLRNATAYGVSPRLRGDLVVNNLVGYAVTTGEVFLKSDGTPWRPLVHIEDIARAFVAVLEAPQERVHNEAFNVGRTEENYRIREVAELVETVVPGARVRLADSAGPDLRNYRVDCSKIARVLPRFQPRWTVRRGIEELYAAYTGERTTLDDLTGPRYQRIKHVLALQAAGRLDAGLRWCAERVREPRMRQEVA